jgi:hypothetical protein
MTKDDDESGVRMADPATHDAFYEITTAKARYCYTLDTRDWTGFGDLMTDDVVLDVSEGTGVPVVHGREAAVEMIRSSLTNARSAHQVHTPLIEVDGDGADGVGCTPVIWGSSRSRVGCASSGARRTCSSSAASTPTRRDRRLPVAAPGHRAGGGHRRARRASRSGRKGVRGVALVDRCAHRGGSGRLESSANGRIQGSASVQFLDELPTNATGKVVKDRLR